MVTGPIGLRGRTAVKPVHLVPDFAQEHVQTQPHCMVGTIVLVLRGNVGTALLSIHVTQVHFSG